jgi:TatD DNase family protein
MELFDMHCHVDLMPDMTEFARQASSENIGIFAVTTTPKAYDQETKMLKPFSNVRIGLGFHPQLVFERFGELRLFEKHIADAEYIGEIGLDFNRRFYFSKEKQLDAFNAIIEWCGNYSGKILSIHSIHSDKATLDILEKHTCTERNKCILHWFSGTLAQLQRAVEIGCYFSVNSAMLKSENGQKLLANIPLYRLLVETDAPFVNETKTVARLKAEINAIYFALQSTYGVDVKTQIQSTSRILLKL